MPKDFTASTAKATVDMGDGGAHSPQIRFTADDESCFWNGTLIYIYACPFVGITPVAPAPTSQLSTFFLPDSDAPPYSPTTTEWPAMMVYNARMSTLSGYKLEFDITEHVQCGTGSMGTVGATLTGSTVCAGVSYPSGHCGDQDSGWITSTCAACTHDDPTLVSPYYRLFNPTTGGIFISHGRMRARWVASGVSPPTYMPDQPFTINWTPPCDGGGQSAGILWITIGVNGCGVVTTTYTALAAAINALNLGITATVLGGHGADKVGMDPSCNQGQIYACGITAPPVYACEMTGADCSGASDWPYTG